MRQLLGFLFVCCFIISCNDNSKSQSQIEREMLAHQCDSLSKTDVQLSFMGIIVGGDISKIDSAVNQGKITIDSCKNGIYICTSLIPYIYENEKRNMEALVRIGTLNNKIASIELFTKNWQAFRYFEKTFCERYYDKYKERLLSYSSYDDSEDYTWQFKNQSLRLYNKTHKEIGEKKLGYNSELGKNEWGIGEVDVLDGTIIEYRHDSLCEKIVDIAVKERIKKDSIANAIKEAEETKRKEANEKLDKEYKNNI